MFPGPPPPISASTMMTNASSPTLLNSRQRGSRRKPVNQTREATISHVSDSVWRGLRREQRGLELEIQHLLDLQAMALLAGSAASLGTSTLCDEDGRGEDGRCTTPTGILSSAVSAGSRIPKSLYIPSRSTPEGNVVPVRQPAKSRRMGLRAVRIGLRESLADLAHLKKDEDAHASAALLARQMALSRLEGLDDKRRGICDELRALKNNDEEPLGQELRKLGLEHDSVNSEIRQLEERLVGMRNRRRWLKEKIDDVKSKREAGLSGYRGALKDVDAELIALLYRPPVRPLDRDMLDRGKDFGEDSIFVGGLEFMRLIPQRRTVEMAKAWWKTEIGILKYERARIGEEQQALRQGSIVWQEVMTLVTDFKRGLRDITEAEVNSSAPSLASDGKEGSSREEMIRSQLPRMGEVVEGLARRLQLAESKRWNLLICAIGAEWEAFKEAHGILKGIVDGANREVVRNSPDERLGATPTADEQGDDNPVNREAQGRGSLHAEIDNKVSPDLLILHLDDPKRGSAKAQFGHATASDRRDSENDVPPEFMAEH